MVLVVTRVVVLSCLAIRVVNDASEAVVFERLLEPIIISVTIRVVMVVDLTRLPDRSPRLARRSVRRVAWLNGPIVTLIQE